MTHTYLFLPYNNIFIVSYITMHCSVLLFIMYYCILLTYVLFIVLLCLYFCRNYAATTASREYLVLQHDNDKWPPKIPLARWHKLCVGFTTCYLVCSSGSRYSEPLNSRTDTPVLEHGASTIEEENTPSVTQQYLYYLRLPV